MSARLVVSRIGDFLQLSLRDKWLLLVALVYVSLIRLILWMLPFREAQGLTARVTSPFGRGHARGREPHRLAWSITVASRCIPAATCLTQALAGQVLLAHHGYLTALRIGVAKDEQGRLDAHAWLEYDGRILIGGEGHEAFQPLRDFPQQAH